MSTETQDVLEVCEQLPVARRAEVADFARFLLSREADSAWERSIDDPMPRPKLAAFAEAALAEGSEPLEPDTL